MLPGLLASYLVVMELIPGRQEQVTLRIPVNYISFIIFKVPGRKEQVTLWIPVNDVSFILRFRGFYIFFHEDTYFDRVFDS